MAEQKTKKKSIFKRIGNFFKEVKIEAFKRIIWPTPNQTVNNTIVVLIMIVLVGAFVFLLDLLFNFGLDLIIK